MIKRGIDQLAKKYLPSESCHEGYLVVFDTRIPVLDIFDPQYHRAGDKQVISFNIGFGKENKLTRIFEGARDA